MLTSRLNKVFSAQALATAVLLAAVGAARAEWQPGLRYGVFDYVSNSDFKIAENPADWTAVTYPEGADTKSKWLTAKGKKGVMVYQGQIRLEPGVYWFAESADDSARLKIGDTVVFSDASWSTPALGRLVVEEGGWYDFDLRFVDGGGGYGPAKSGWMTRSDMAFGWKLGDEGGDSSQAANKVADAYSVPKNAAGATLENCIFRYDDGLGFSDELLVRQSPIAVPVSHSPAEGQNGLVSGSAVDCSSEAEYESEDGSWRAVLSGYVISNRVDGVWAEREAAADGTSSFTYAHDGNANTLYWTWTVQYRLTTSATEGGSVDVATGWFDRNARVTLTATHPSAPFVCWLGDLPEAEQTKNPVTVTMDQARSLSATFGASEFYVDATDGSDSNPGTAEAPFKTVGKAVQLAADGIAVLLRPGTHAVSSELVLNKAVTLKGLGERPTDVILKGRQDGNFRVVRLDNREARLENLTVSHGNLRGSSSASRQNGCNVLIDANGGMVTNCVLTQALQQYHSIGGGVYLNSADALVTHCVITNNYLTDGNGEGGTGVGMAAGRVEYCLIADNFDSPNASPNHNRLSAVYVTGGTMEHCTVVDNMHCGCAVYLSGGEVRRCVFARNHNLYNSQDGQIRTSSAALKASAFADCVWDGGDISESCPQGVVKFADYANGDYRLASDSAGVVRGGHDWGCYETAESTTVVEPEAPASVAVAAGGDIRQALRRVREGGEVVLRAGTHPVVNRPIMLTRAVTLRGEGDDPSAVLVTKGSSALLGSLVCLSHAGAVLSGVSVVGYSTNNGLNQCAMGVSTVQDGGTVSNCVLRSMQLTTSSHAGTALRIRRAGAHVTRCVISNITTHANTSYGGAIAIEADSLIDNCLIADCNNDTWNSPTSSHWSRDTPGAVYQTAGTIANCTFVDCKAPRVAGVKTTGGVMRDCIFWNCRRFNADYGELETIGVGSGMTAENWLNVWADLAPDADNPRWTSATAAEMAFVDASAGNYRLTTASVARNSGERRPAAGVGALDLDGNPRRIAPRVDAGCFEEQHGCGLMLFFR